jgi:hypothetical protein
MPSERAVWSEDVCTCEHPQSKHRDGAGYCVECAGIHAYGSAGPLDPPCMRYQWNGEPRRRIW